MRPILISLSTILLAACAQEQAVVAQAEPAPKAPALEQLWVTEGFAGPEGVARTPGGDYFISNIAGAGTDKDGEGWISILSVDGEITNERFAEGLDAPKGMAVFEGRLYVSDIDQIRILDTTTGEALGAVPIEGAGFLNDVTVWKDHIFVSDSRTARIHRVHDGKASVWLEDAEALRGVNGLLGDGDSLLIATMGDGALLRADEDGSLTLITKGMENADGIGITPDNGWLVSSWPGEIHYVSASGDTSTLIDTTTEEITQNDLTMFGDTVIVPNLRNDTVTAWRFEQ